MLEFLASNWLWIVLIGALVLMHRGGGCGSHGGHAGHGDHGDHRDRSTPGDASATPDVPGGRTAEPAGDAGTPGQRHAA